MLESTIVNRYFLIHLILYLRVASNLNHLSSEGLL